MTAKTEKPLSPLEKTKKLAVSILNRRPLSEQELRKKLAEKECEASDIDEVIALCLDYGFLNDGEYAAMLARHYAARSYGPSRIKAELKRRGVAEEHWPRALEQLGSAAEALDRLLAQKLRGKDPDDRKEIEKAGAALFRKGYSWEQIRAAVNRYKES